MNNNNKLSNNIDNNINSRSKLLSIIYYARNDNYKGNFKYRLSSSINFLARNMFRTGRLHELEIIVTDWNSSFPLFMDLGLTAYASEVTKFINIPTEFAMKHNIEDLNIFVAGAVNVGLRRASGEYLMIIDSDTLIPSHSLLSLLNILDGKVYLPNDVDKLYFVGGRRNFPLAVAENEPNLDELDWLCLQHGQEMLLEKWYHGLGTHSSSYLAHKSIFLESGGANESLKYAAWHDADITLRMSQYYHVINLESLGVSMYHIEHGIGNIVTKNPYKVSKTFKVNDDNWGFAKELFETQTATYIVNDIIKYEELENEIWGIDPSIFIASITGEITQKHVETTFNILDQYLDILINNPQMNLLLQHIQMTERDIEEIKNYRLTNKTAHGIYFCLSWYSLIKPVKIFLDIGIQESISPLFIIKNNKHVDIYGIDNWQERNDLRVIPSNYFLSRLMHLFDYTGYCRLITGDIDTGINRLYKSFKENVNFKIDLSLFRINKFSSIEVFFEQYNLLKSKTKAGGAIIISHENIDIFDIIWENITKENLNKTFIKLNTIPVGIVLFAVLKEHNNSNEYTINFNYKC